MTFLFGITKTAVSTGMSTWFIQIYVDLRMAEMSISTVAPNNSFSGFDWRNFINKLDSPVLIDVTLGVNETNISVILVIKDLKGIW